MMNQAMEKIMWQLDRTVAASFLVSVATLKKTPRFLAQIVSHFRVTPN